MENKENEKPLILIVDDVAQNVQVLANILDGQDCRIAPALGGEQAIKMCQQFNPAIVLLDIMMPDINGIEVLQYIQLHHPETSVVMITAKDDSETIVKCVKEGAEDYLVKPLDSMRTLIVVKNLLRMHKLIQANKSLSINRNSSLNNPEAFKDIVSDDLQMLSTFKYIENVSVTDDPILITGETGVGKDLLANAIHKSSGVFGEFVSVFASALDDNSFSETIFGKVEAERTIRSGMIEKAENGTLYLDQIGELSESNQAKLLRLIQTNEYLAVGSDVVKKLNARIILSTSQELEGLVSEKRFRDDLYYCLNPHKIHIQPLREKKSDIDLLLKHILKESAVELGKTIPTYPIELLVLLKSYHYPGNIRELKGMIKEAMLRHQGRMLSMKVFKDMINSGRQRPSSTSISGDVGELTLENTLASLNTLPNIKEIGNKLIVESLKRSENNLEVASDIVGLSRPALYQRIRRDDELSKLIND